MNWKLIFTLSVAGICMGTAALFGLTKNIEPIQWLVIFVFYAVWIVKYAPGKYFLHGFLVSVINGIWVSLIHSAFFALYIQNNPEMMANYEKLPPWVSPRTMVLIIGPFIGAATGLIAGLFAIIAGKWFKRNILKERTQS